MPRLTVSIDEEDIAYIEENVEDSGEYDSKSAFVRTCIREHNRLAEETDRLRREKRQILAQRDENRELVEYVNDRREQEQRERERRHAPVWKRAKYWVFGVE